MTTCALSARTAAAAAPKGARALSSKASSSSSILGRSTKNAPARVRMDVTTRAGEAPPGLTELPKDTDAFGIYGAVAPFADGFDPLGIHEGNEFDYNTLKRYREAEITNGRVAMLATVGILVGEQVEGSSFLFDSQITGPAINHFQQVPDPFWQVLVSVIGVAESARIVRGWAAPWSTELFALKPEYTPGDLGVDPFGLYGRTPKEMLAMKVREVNNGRLAMFAVIIMVLQEYNTQMKIFEFWGF
jgi:hypothetical protein